MSGECAGLSASFFDHVVAGRSGHTDTIASFTQAVYLPEFVLAREDAVDRIVDAVAHRKIEFPSDPVFSEHFRLVGADEERLRELFAGDMRELLNRLDPNWRIEGYGHTLVVYQPGYAVKPDEYADFVEEATGIAKNFFSHCHLRQPAF